MNDKHIRDALRLDLHKKYGGDPNTCVIEELSLEGGSTRADVAVVNGVMHGFELKSDRDSLIRLADQTRAYAAVFDYITLVVAERHLRNAVDIIPDWWGIRVARYVGGKLLMRDLKLPLPNPDIDPFAVVSLLWRDEALCILEEVGATRGMYSKPKASIFLKLIEEFELDLLRERVRQSLRTRAGLRSGARQG